MHSRRFACFLLGVWLGSALLAAWVAAMNAGSPKRVLAEPNSPAAALELKELGGAAERAFRYQAAEQNRGLLDNWGATQVALGTALLLFLLFATVEKKTTLALALVMLVFTGLQRFLLAPEMNALGRILDFAPPGLHAAERSKLAGANSAYYIMEAIKWAAGAALAVKLLLRRRGSGNVRQQVQAVDKPDHRHVNG
jgi:hypothetical protein